MKLSLPTRSSLLVAATCVGTLALVASGCHHHRPPCHAHRGHQGEADRKSPRAGKGHHHRGKASECRCGKGADAKGMKKHQRLGAPKLLSARMLKAHAEWLALTPDQVTKIDAIKKDAKAAKQGRSLQKKRAVMALKMEWLQDRPDPAKIRDLVKALFAVKQAGIDSKAETLLKLKETLTDEQYKKILTSRGHRGGKGCCGAGDCCGGGKGCCKGGDCCGGGKGCCKGGDCCGGGKGCCKGGDCCKAGKGHGPRGHGPHGHGPHGHGPHGHGPHGKAPGAPCPHCVK